MIREALRTQQGILVLMAAAVVDGLAGAEVTEAVDVVAEMVVVVEEEEGVGAKLGWKVECKMKDGPCYFFRCIFFLLNKGGD